jgi:hypothetical protein
MGSWGQSSGHVLDVIQVHVIRHVRLERKVSGERGSELRRSDRWTAGKVRVGAEARRGKARRQAKSERGEAGHHSSRTSARNVGLCNEDLHVSARQQGGASGLNQNQRHASAARATHLRCAVRLPVDCQRDSCGAAVRRLSASFILGKLASEVLMIRAWATTIPPSSTSRSESWRLCVGRPGVRRPVNSSSSSSSF